MAVIAGVAVVFIARHIVVLIVGFGSAVTFKAGEDPEISRIRMTLRTRGPLVAMSAGKDREIQAVMLREIRPIPRPGVVTNLAVLRKTRRLVIWVIGAVVVALVT